MKKTGIELIAEERKEQIEKHGKTIEFDVENNDLNQLTAGAHTLMVYPTLHEQNNDVIRRRKPIDWDDNLWLKMCKKSYTERLSIAGALIAAEIDRLQAEEE